MSNAVLDLDSMSDELFRSAVAFGKEEMSECYSRARVSATVYLSGYYIVDDDDEISFETST